MYSCHSFPSLQIIEEYAFHSQPIEWANSMEVIQFVWLSGMMFPKTNICTQSDGLEQVDSGFKKMAMFGIYVRFLGCTHPEIGRMEFAKIMLDIVFLNRTRYLRLQILV